MLSAPLFPCRGVETRSTEFGVVLSFAVPMDYEYVEGHFPENPIVPGVTQVGWALGAARIMSEGASALTISRFRFMRPVRPGQRIELSVERDGIAFRCRVLADGELAAKGSLRLWGEDVS